MTKFIADVNVGKLAKWLRMLGFDTLYDSQYGDAEIVRISLAENRIILTRDTGIAKRKSAKNCILIEADESIRQLQQVIAETGIEIDEDNTFTRCIICNTPLESVKKEAVAGNVPAYIYETHDEFARCPKCNKIFWKGSHLAGMKSIIKRIQK